MRIKGMQIGVPAFPKTHMRGKGMRIGMPAIFRCRMRGKGMRIGTPAIFRIHWLLHLGGGSVVVAACWRLRGNSVGFVSWRLRREGGTRGGCIVGVAF